LDFVVLLQRLWNSTLVEDYPGVDAVHIFSRAQLKIPDDNRQDPVNDVANALTISMPDLKLKVGLRTTINSLNLSNFCVCRWKRKEFPGGSTSLQGSWGF